MGAEASQFTSPTNEPELNRAMDLTYAFFADPCSVDTTYWPRTEPHGHLIICNGDHNIPILDKKCNCWYNLAWWVLTIDDS